MNEIPKIADEAGKHANDMNWLAVVLLFLAIIALVWLFRWIIGELKQLFQEANEGRVKCAEIIAVNTNVINENTEFLKRK